MNERAIFEAAIDIDDESKRRIFVKKACADNIELQKQIESLLASHENIQSFLDLPILGRAPTNTEKQIDQAVGFSRDGIEPSESHRSLENQDENDEEKIDLSFLNRSIKPGSIGTLGHYEILQVLGQGAFGVVFKAFDEKLQRLVAIKVMCPQMAATSPPRKRFLREARAAAAIRHDNVVQVYSVEEQPLPYLVMEYIDGVTLQQKQDETGPLQVAELLHLGRQIANGLAAAHAKGLIHRDIKPGNILLEKGVDQKVKITDFGLARAADDASMTRTGTISGTPMYMAPEQAMGQALDHRADLFSFGSVLYQLACGRPPFRAPTAIAVLRRVIEDTPRPLQEIMPEIPDWLAAIINTLLAKETADRYQSASEVADIFAHYQSEFQLHCNEAVAPIGIVSQGVNRPFRVKPPRPIAPTAAALPKASGVPQSAGRFFRIAAVLAGFMFLSGGLVLLAFVRLYRAQSDTAPFRDIGMLIPENIPVVVDQYGYLASAIDLPNVAVPVQNEPVPSELVAVDPWRGWDADAPPPALAPFDAQQANAHQEAWAKHLGIPVESTDDDGMTFVLIPPGEFMMGSQQSDIDKLSRDLHQAGATEFDMFVAKFSGPQHLVRITNPFYLSAHEVTVASYRQFIEATNYVTSAEQLGVKGLKWTDSATGENADNCAVIGVSWDDAKAYCAWRSKRDEVNCDLPSEAQWEYSCRAGTTTLWSFGDDPAQLAEHAVYRNDSFWPAEVVGTKKPNPFGIFDMHGNADEWCLDWHNSVFFQISPVNDPCMVENPQDVNSGRVARGGASRSAAWWTRSATRPWDFPATPANPKGFRIVLSGDLAAAAKIGSQEVSLSSAE